MPWNWPSVKGAAINGSFCVVISVRVAGGKIMFGVFVGLLSCAKEAAVDGRPKQKKKSKNRLLNCKDELPRKTWLALIVMTLFH
jgi:hypothetical protein